ncbi:MAG: class I SAM-dependent methyltransferase [Phenylobacterium sp.]|uniref:TylF/MycF/NovP-related O-methyltransferase n=1 Tax=Phenylobacterium sp. TaxID=1871053 RepID=UPI001A3A97EB|nr:TylF/MycF/NovP-related O-methyltransferase [Phenylobacterium sp.]MBL8770413.1 class I SAM-dependent methyltransferase [Phenylobacterium sp.]
MTDISIAGLGAAKLVVMADGLLKLGDIETAKALYRAALPKASPQLQRRIHIRLGVAHKVDNRLVPTFKALDDLEAIPNANVFIGDGLATWLKALPFFEDQRFLDIAQRHADLLPIRNWHWNLQTALWAVAQARKVPGDLVELGVFKGHTTLFCAEYLDFAAWPKRWRLYDTFEGIPEDQLDAGWSDVNRRLYGDTFTFEEVRQRFAHIPNIEVIKGRVPEILHERSPGDAISFLHIDMNNATAEIAALDVLFDRVSPGGVILFDDFAWSTADAQRRAETAWFAARGEQVLPLPTGQGLYVKR